MMNLLCVNSGTLKKAVLLTLSLAFGFSDLSAQDPLSTGLIAKYCFDGNADDCVGTKHCTVNGATPTTDRLGRSNRAYYFDGVDDYIKLPDDVWISGDFTISGWLWVESFRGFARFYEFGNGAPGDNIVYTATPTEGYGTIDAFVILRNLCSPTGEESANAGPFPIGKWVHVVTVFKGLTGSVWRDGVNVTIRTSGFTAPPCSVLRSQCYFGKSTWTRDQFYQGKMDDIRIYNRALSALEIDSLYKLDDVCIPTGIGEYNSANQGDYLSQNTPNPLTVSSVINYKLPERTQKASLSIFDIMGRQVKTVNLDPNKSGSVVIAKNEMLPGLYFYTLEADGQTIGKRKMEVFEN